MISDVKIGESYWFIENWNNSPQKCVIKRYHPETETECEYWDGNCLTTLDTRGFRKEDLYYTEEEVNEACEEKYNERLSIFKKSIDNPKKFLTELVKTKTWTMTEYSTLDTATVEKHLKELSKLYFNIELD